MRPSVAKGNTQCVEFGAHVLRCSEYHYFWAGSGIEGVRLENRVPTPNSTLISDIYLSIYIYIRILEMPDIHENVTCDIHFGPNRVQTNVLGQVFCYG